jgi:glycyl-tRNA synthetase
MDLLITPYLLDMLKQMSGDEDKSRRLMSLLKKRGFLQPAFELYGGVAGLYDYGPLGGRLRRNVMQKWLNHWVSLGNIVEIDSPTVTPEEVLKASGHIGAFNDYASECKPCSSIFRTDHLLEDVHPNPESLSVEDLDAEVIRNKIVCPSCKKSDWLSAQPLNLMFSTTIGASKSGRKAYMRPETAQGMFLQYPSIYRHFRGKLPFGAVQMGKGYRNEISPRQGIIRLREFNMAELEYFIDPHMNTSHDLEAWDGIELKLIPDPEGNKQDVILSTVSDAVKKGIIRHETVGWFMIKTFELMSELGIDTELIRFRQHEGDEMAHYATDCWDLEILGGYGWIECVGIAYRGCYDLEAHEIAAKSNELKAWREFEENISVEKTILAPIQSIIGPIFKDKSKLITEYLENLDELPADFPLKIIIEGEEVIIEEKMVELKNIQTTERGEWFTPHVIEPAFGIDRIMWHILEHSHDESLKEGDETYTVLKLNKKVAPVDFSVYPLYEKDGMKEMAQVIIKSIRLNKGINVNYDGSKSIGRRYARGDEIGVPYAITIDHQTLEDSSITLRERDSQEQKRMAITELLEFIANF